MKISALCCICLGVSIASRYLLGFVNPFPVGLGSLLIIMVAHKLSWAEVIFLELFHFCNVIVDSWQNLYAYSLMIEPHWFMWVIFLFLGLVMIPIDKMVNKLLPKKWKLRHLGY